MQWTFATAKGGLEITRSCHRRVFSRSMKTAGLERRLENSETLIRCLMTTNNVTGLNTDLNTSAGVNSLVSLFWSQSLNVKNLLK